MDGLKISLRKILFAAFKKGLTSEIKVAQFSGYVSEHSGYHHGEASLNAAIVGMAQNFVGSNNINLLEPNGQFGCLSPDTPVLMWNSSVKNAKDIVVGDVLVGDDGKTRTVLRTTNGIDEMYEIVGNNGKKLVVNSQHILTLYFKKNAKIEWKNSNKSWIMMYFDGETVKNKTIQTKESPSKTESHFNKSTLTKDAALLEMEKFRSEIVGDFKCIEIVDIKLEDYMKLSSYNKRSFMMMNNLMK
jgi:hypothetical protein